MLAVGSEGPFLDANRIVVEQDPAFVVNRCCCFTFAGPSRTL